MNIPLPLPVTTYQQWTCIRCSRLFLWETSLDRIIQPAIAHCFSCRGDNLARIAGDRIGIHRKE
ncbi:MAG: hypothetical protein Q7J73_08220 [Dehalococcoidales bacterium]|nr:hypothetical protein [Dehalococcoidales bacterium]